MPVIAAVRSYPQLYILCSTRLWGRKSYRLREESRSGLQILGNQLEQLVAGLRTLGYNNTGARMRRHSYFRLQLLCYNPTSRCALPRNR